MVKISNLTKKYGEVTVLDKFSVSLPQNSKTVLMGDSGKGKTTLLRIIAGLECPDDGRVETNGKVAYMFQEHRLLPWKNALDNVKAFLPRDKHALAEKYLSAVGLADAAKKYPSELSGGMAQRVAYARFLAYTEAHNAQLLLLDEPFSALDFDTAKKMIGLLLEISRGKTLLIVTHSDKQADLINGNLLYI